MLLVAAPRAQCPGPQPEEEPNDTPATANILPSAVGEWYFFGIPGAISPAGDVDCFQISAEAGNRFWLLVDTGGTQQPGATSRDSLLEVLAADGSTVLELDDDDGTGNGHGSVISSLDASAVAGLVAPATGTYYLRVTAAAAGVIAPYLLVVGVSTSAPVAEVEPNDTATAAQLFYPEPVLSSLSSADDVDWYHFDLLDAGRPFIIVDGDPERDGVPTDVALDFQTYGIPMPPVDSSSGAGSPPPPAEAVVPADVGLLRISGPAAGSYLLFIPYSGDGCSVPVELTSFDAR